MARLSKTDRRILDAVEATEPAPYVVNILNHLNRDRQSTWLARKLPFLDALRRFGMGNLYVRLDRLERLGYLVSSLMLVTFPERGNLPRRYYHRTSLPN